jgi:ribosome-dependent ATPase
METRLRRGDVTLAIEIPPDFGKDLKRGRQPQVGVWLDGSLPFRAETAKAYVLGVHQFYLDDLVRSQFGESLQALPVNIETRFRYNQNFESVYAMVPGSIMMLLIWVPAMMTAVGVVREKEMGSITNFYATPVNGFEFLLGKQFPYLGLALVNFTCLVLFAVFLFQVPIKGSFLALALGALLYVIATTGFGLLVSSFVKTQIAAVFAAAIISVVPAINFSGYLSPTASLEGGARVMSQIFPSTHFQQISLGTFTKALEIGDLVNSLLSIAAIITVYLLLALTLLKTQER